MLVCAASTGVQRKFSKLRWLAGVASGALTKVGLATSKGRFNSAAFIAGAAWLVLSETIMTICIMASGIGAKVSPAPDFMMKLPRV